MLWALPKVVFWTTEADEKCPADAETCPSCSSRRAPGWCFFFKKPFLPCLLAWDRPRQKRTRCVGLPPPLSPSSKLGASVTFPERTCLLPQLGRWCVKDIVTIRNFKGCFKSPASWSCLAVILWLQLSIHPLMPQYQGRIWALVAVCSYSARPSWELRQTSLFVLAASRCLWSAVVADGSVAQGPRVSG